MRPTLAVIVSSMPYGTGETRSLKYSRIASTSWNHNADYPQTTYVKLDTRSVFGYTLGFGFGCLETRNVSRCSPLNPLPSKRGHLVERDPDLAGNDSTSSIRFRVLCPRACAPRVQLLRQVTTSMLQTLEGCAYC